LALCREKAPPYRIKLNVEQFDGQFGKHVILDVTWSVAKQKDENDPVVKNSLIKEPVSTEDYEAIVAAKSRAIAVLSQEIVPVITTMSKQGSMNKYHNIKRGQDFKGYK
jgi:uncharacterized lipoprotein YmbA